MVALYLLGVGVAYMFGGNSKRVRDKPKVGSDLV